MDLEYSTVKELKIHDSVVREQAIETDIVMPEYFPAIARILKCFVLPDEEAITVADGRISVSGTATVKLLYTDDEKKLHCYRTETKYTKVLQSDIHDEKCSVRITQDTVSLNYKALGPKRVEVKACIAVKAEILCIEETELISSADESAELLTSEREHCDAVCVYCREISGKESIRCESADKKITSVISSAAVPVVEKTEVISNKIMLKGKNEIRVICGCEDGTVNTYDISVPFTDVVDCYGISESDACNTVFYCSLADVELADGTDNTFAAVFKNKFVVFASRKSSVTYVEDAYSLRADAECKYLSPVIACGVTELKGEERITAEADIFDDGMFSVCAVFVDNVAFSFGRDDGCTVINGSLCFNAVVSDGEGQYSLVIKKAPFEHKLPGDIRCVGSDMCVRGVCADVSANGKINLSCILGFTVLAQNCEKIKALAEFNVAETSEAFVCQRAVVYFAEKGERVWDIAKRNKTTAANIREYNSVGDVIEEDTKLIFADF